MKPKELKGVLESLYGGEWLIQKDVTSTWISNRRGRYIAVVLKNEGYEKDVPYIVIDRKGMSNKEYKELTKGFTLQKGCPDIFDFDESMVTKLGPFLSESK